MHTTGANDRTKGCLYIFDSESRFGLTKLAAAAIRGALIVAVLSALLLIAARPAQAQTETVLYNFTGGNDGLHPESSLISDGAGNFYGTTLLGGQGCPGWNQYGCGVVFEISPNGSGGWKQTVLHSFSGPPDAANPFRAPVIFDSEGNLYGTTEFGGTFNWGAVFELSPAGPSWTETILYSFTGGADGGHPATSLVMDKAGNLFGTTSEYQAPGNVFELSPSAGGWTLQVIYAAPTAPGLTMDASGNIYGATTSTVFELSPNGNGGWNPTVLHTFTGPPEDGSSPVTPFVFDQAGNLYGMTYAGGTNNSGTVYQLSPGENGAWTEQILYSFMGGNDGAQPWAGVVLDAGGNIYGTTSLGGMYGDGTVFELVAPVGAGNYQEKVLWSFNGTDGLNPYCTPILDSAGNLYGTVASGGSKNAGVVFEVNPLPAATTTTTLTSSLNPSITGKAVTFTATVSSGSGGTPTGKVTFMDGVTSLGTKTLSGGTAAFVTYKLSPGSHNVTAVYGGSTSFAGSTSAALNQFVLATTTTALSSTPNPSTYGQAVMFTAEVTSSLGAPPDGEPVSFMDGTKVLGTGILSGGSAIFTPSTLKAVTTAIRAVYGGDTNFGGSKSPVVYQVVGTATTTTVLASSVNPSNSGQPVTFVATVTPQFSGTPTGAAIFYDGTTKLQAVSLSDGIAEFTTSKLTSGTHIITATYNGRAGFTGSSASLTQTVN